MPFWAYMLHCRGGVFYTGHTDDLERRVAQHQSGLVEGFTQDRHPLELVWSQEFPTRYEALGAELRIKGWSRKKKLALIRGDWDEISRLVKTKGGASTGSARTGLGAEPVEISPNVIAKILAEARDAQPREGCGLLLGSPVIRLAVPCENVHPSPHTHFEIDPIALIAAHKADRSGGLRIAGYYHSHPAGPPIPSAADRAAASGDGRVWAIVGAGEVRFWRDAPGGFETLSYLAVDG